MAELLHAGAWAATAVSTCVAASDHRLRVRESVLAIAMLLAMSDVVLGWGLLLPVGWAALLLMVALLSVITSPGAGSISSADRSTRAMDALGAVLMAGLFVLMSGDVHASADGHGSHAASGEALTWAALATSVLFAAASVHMALTMRMPHITVPVRVRVLRRTAPLAMGSSVVLMACTLA